MADPKFTEQLGYLIARANRLIEEDLSKRLQSNGIAIEQYRVLKSLEEEGPLPMGRLAERVLVEPATLTKIIDRMVRDNLVYRAPDPDDRRKVLILTAAEGKALYKRLSGVSSAQEKRLAEVLAGEKAAELKTLLRELLER